MFEGAENGIVFERGNDGVIARFEHAEKGEIERLRAAARKDDPLKSVSRKELRKQIAAGKHMLALGDGEAVAAPSGVGARPHCRKHGALYRCGLETFGRGVVKIDHTYLPMGNHCIIRRQVKIMTVLAVFRSRAQALAYFSAVKSAGIPAQTVSTPKEAGVGCGISVKFDERFLPRAKALLIRMPATSFSGFLRGGSYLHGM